MVKKKVKKEMKRNWSGKKNENWKKIIIKNEN